MSHAGESRSDTNIMRSISSQPLRPQHDARRSGLALLVVLIALAIVASIGVTLLKMALMHHRQAQREMYATQSRCLAESAFDLAHRRLKADPKLERFTWSIPAADLDGRHPAEIVVEIQSVKEAPQLREVRIVADFPNNIPHRSRTRLTRQIEL